MAGTAVISALLCACAQGQGQTATVPIEAPPSPADVVAAEPEAWPEVPMPSARVSFMFCRGADENGIPLTSMSREALTDVLSKCLPAGFVGVRVTYDGPIEPGAAELFRRIDQLAVEIEPDTVRHWPFLLMINSGGGDVAEAMAMGNVLSTRDWSIRVELPNGKCYSACVLVYAAATKRGKPTSVAEFNQALELWAAGDNGSHRQVTTDRGTNLGIHRLLPTLSAATNVDELYADTQGAVQLIGDYLARHGVSRTLAEDMMTVPSNEIRLLTVEEVERYGLGEVNSARADLDRLDILRRCGPDYAERRAVFIRERAACWDMITSDDSSVPLAEACMDSLKQKTRIPDASCPDPRVGG